MICEKTKNLPRFYGRFFLKSILYKLFIIKEPLLKLYFDIFKEVINGGNKKIVIIGYGFTDKHINNILLQGAKYHRLKIYIINPIDPPQFRIKMERTFKSKDFEIFWKSLSGYFPHSLIDIFPYDQHQHPTVLYQNIKKSLTS
ncbi:hypothetical protein C4544_05465 [candidate division WS5 bacterium]|uniref:SIR2-like domain-containing protein n=1 Tax=candidate division WS5 bacterium TaxID=2093353 RepID=A0A419DB46_9BACT|nr:MAG: hypothetical protein C4544_05465 [candidate division WS5 bacterium]